MEGHHSKNDRNLRPPTRILERVSCDFGDLQGHIYIYYVCICICVSVRVCVLICTCIFVYIDVFVMLLGCITKP